MRSSPPSIQRSAFGVRHGGSVLRRSGRSAFVLLPLLLALILVVPSAEARIGETSFQFAIRYGAPKDTVSAKTADKNSPLVRGAIHHTYEYQGWKIRAAFLHPNGPAVRIDFSKLPNGQDLPIRNSELEAIKTVNTPFGMTWDQMSGGASQPMPASLSGIMTDKIWRRTDGALVSLHGPMIVRIELPTARRYEEHQKIREAQRAQPVVRGS